MISYSIDHNYGSRYVSTKTAGELKYCIYLDVLIKKIIPLALVEYLLNIRAGDSNVLQMVSVVFHSASTFIGKKLANKN